MNPCMAGPRSPAMGPAPGMRPMGPGAYGPGTRGPPPSSMGPGGPGGPGGGQGSRCHQQGMGGPGPGQPWTSIVSIISVYYASRRICLFIWIYVL